MKNKRNILTLVSLILIIAVYLLVYFRQDGSSPGEDQNSVQNEASGNDITQPAAEDNEKPESSPADNDAEQPEGGPADNDTDQPEGDSSEYVVYMFRNDKLLTQHYEKHGIEMGFDSKEAYEKAASDVVNNPAALHKTEKEDGDYVYYVEETNEFVIVSTDGYLRTYFLPSAGIAYYNRQ